jgi:hypothetical protein
VAAKVINVEALAKVLNQCKDTLEWQVDRNDPTIDFLYPKLRYALSLIQSTEEEDDEGFRRERTTGDELRDYVSTYDFVLPTDSNDEE